MSKRIILLSVAILFIAGIAFGATPGYRLSPGTGEIVQRGYASDPPKRFRIVRYAGTTATLVKDSIVIWDLTDDDGVTVTTTTVSGDSAVAGIIVQQALTEEVGCSTNTAFQDIGKRNWTWLQTYGKSEVRIDATYAADEIGDAMGTGTTAGEACSWVPASAGPGFNARHQGYAGFFYDAAAATTDDVECFLKCE